MRHAGAPSRSLPQQISPPPPFRKALPRRLPSENGRRLLYSLGVGVDVALEDEDGQQLDLVGDPTSALARALPDPRDSAYSCLRFVDRYGDTTFNSIQIPLVIQELTRLQQGANEDTRKVLRQIQELAERALDEGPHLYLKLYGD